MHDIEAIIVLLLLFMTVPDLCRKIRRPALAYSAFVLFGLGLGPWLDPSLSTMIREAGSVGFLLLLFEVGMEIELPRIGRLLRPVGYAVTWSLLQVPLALAVGHLVGLEFTHNLVAALSLTGCSVGMAYAAWKSYPGLAETTRKRILRIMVALELWTILALVLGSAVLKGGLNHWTALTMGAVASVIFLLARFAGRLVPVFQTIITETTHWRVHLVVLLILVVCAIGERLGLGGPKTAFILGLALNQTRHKGMNLDQHMSPISQRFLIPMFFVALGLQIEWQKIFSSTGLLAFCAAGLLLGVRMLLHRRLLPTGGDRNAFLLFSPNLTMVALGANALLEYAGATDAAAWLLLTGLFVTIPSILFLPALQENGQPAAKDPETGPAVPRPTAAPATTESATSARASLAPASVLPSSKPVHPQPL
jgi:Kef-type K+ transport system membrane component KefB